MKSYSGLFRDTCGAKHFIGSTTSATAVKMSGIIVSLPIGIYDTGIKIHKQNEHIPDTKEFKSGKSEIHISLTELQSLVNSKAGTGAVISKTTKERVDFGKIIGNWVDVKTGKSIPTTKGIIIYSNSGTHVVPARP